MNAQHCVCWIVEVHAQKNHALTRVTGQLPSGCQALIFAPGHISLKQANNYLGRECDYLVIDVREGLAVDAFAALLGTLRGGGVLLLLVEDFAAWPDQIDASRRALASYPFAAEQVGQRFLHRLCRYYAQACCVKRLTLDQFARQHLTVPPRRQSAFVLTHEQQQLVDAVKRVALGHARRPLVLTADRGRGKSAALGEALAQLLIERPDKKIIVLAPNRAAVQALFARLPSRHSVQFSLPADYLRNLPARDLPCDLLVVDEAAAIPLPVLQTMLQSHNRLVFSSTVHGYEGSGRGFALRFARLLDQQMPQWRHLSIQQPVRRAADDPLEQLNNDVLLLNAELPDTPTNKPPNYTLRWISQDTLAADERLLRRLFALLVSAHYQTRPSDLRQLMDAPDVHILLAMADDMVLGAVVAVREGGLDTELAQAICTGERRPRGHLLLQSLACHAGFCAAPTWHLLRIMRIAVHPPHWRQGIGGALLHATAQFARQNHADLLGVSFGLDTELMSFWQTAGFQAVRIGHKRDPASGARSAQMLFGLSQTGVAFCRMAVQRFKQQLPWRLAQPFNDLDAISAGILMHARNCGDLPLSASDQADLRAYANGQRPVHEVLPVLWRWYCHVLAQGRQTALDVNQQTLLLSYILQYKSAVDIQRYLSIKGRAEFENILRESIKSVLTSGCCQPTFSNDINH